MTTKNTDRNMKRKVPNTTWSRPMKYQVLPPSNMDVSSHQKNANMTTMKNMLRPEGMTGRSCVLLMQM